MSTENDVARSLGSWLKENRHEDADRVLAAVFEQIPMTPQRRSFWFARRFFQMSGFSRFVVAAATVAIVVAGVIVATRPQVGGPTPTVVPTPTRVQRQFPLLLDTLPEGTLQGGIYQIDAVFPVRLNFTLPTPAFAHARGAADRVWVWDQSPVGPSPTTGIEFQVASNVFPDPCHWAAGTANPPIGASVDDLVTAMTTLVGFQAGPVTDVTIGGLPAKAFDLTNEIDASTCDEQEIRAFLFAGSSGASVIGSGLRERIYVMNVQGTRLMIMTGYYPKGFATNDADAAANLRKIVESIAFQPVPTATPTPDATPVTLNSTHLGVTLSGGRYAFEIGPAPETHFSVELAMKAGWVPQQLAVSQVAFAGPNTNGAGLGFYSIQRVYRDPCHPEAGYAGGYLGTANSHDLVNELGALAGFDAGPLSTVRIGDLTATHFVISNTIDTETAGCTDGQLLPLFMTRDADRNAELETRTNDSPATNGGTSQEVWIVDRAGWALAIIGEVGGTSPEEDRAALEEIIGSITLGD